MAKRSVSGRVTRRRGRSVVALTLLGFVLVATCVIWRRTYAISQSRTEQRLLGQRDELRALKAQLQRDIREAASRDALTQVAERRLRLRMPSDSQVIVIDRKDIPAPRRDAAK